MQSAKRLCCAFTFRFGVLFKHEKLFAVCHKYLVAQHHSTGFACVHRTCWRLKMYENCSELSNAMKCTRVAAAQLRYFPVSPIAKCENVLLLFYPNPVGPGATQFQMRFAKAISRANCNIRLSRNIEAHKRSPSPFTCRIVRQSTQKKINRLESISIIIPAAAGVGEAQVHISLSTLKIVIFSLDFFCVDQSMR